MFTGMEAGSDISVFKSDAYDPVLGPLLPLQDEEKQVHQKVITGLFPQRTTVHHSALDCRSRPECFTSFWTEIGFVISISLSQVFDEYLTSGFFALMPVLMEEFQLSDTSIAWPASVTPLFISAFLLSFGRLADMYGGFTIYAGGIAWASSWTILAGFSNNYTMFMFCRAMQGLGAAAHLPAGLAMLGKIYRPGPRKNMVFSIYGAMAPLGSFVGILVASLVSQYAHWSWYFWIGGLIALVALIGTITNKPPAGLDCVDGALRMDWVGSISLAASLMLLVYSITEAADVKQWWRAPRVAATGILATIGFAVTAVIERRFVGQPLIPASVFQIDYIRPLLIGLLPSYGAVSVYTCYATLHIRDVIGIGPMQMLAWFTPMAVGGCLLAMVGGRLMHIVSGTVILVITSIAVMISSALFIYAPRDPSYWTWIFPAMVCATIAIDLVYSVVNVFLSSNLPEHQQGLAGSLAHALVQFSGALFLALAKVVMTSTSTQGDTRDYTNAFWLQLSCGIVALIIFSAFVRVDRASEDESFGEAGSLDDRSHISK